MALLPRCACFPWELGLLRCARACALGSRCACCTRRAAGKRYDELVSLEEGIQDTLDSGTAADPEYWAAVLKRVSVHKAKARLREIHAGG